MTASLIHKHIRPAVLAVWAIAWIALCGSAIWLNGGFEPVPGQPSLVPMSVACVASAAFAGLIVSSSGVQSWVLRPGGDIRAIRSNLWLIVFITGALGVGSILFMWLPARA